MNKISTTLVVECKIKISINHKTEYTGHNLMHTDGNSGILTSEITSLASVLRAGLSSVLSTVDSQYLVPMVYDSVENRVRTKLAPFNQD